MRPLCCVRLISRLLLVQAMPQSPFNGVWKVDLAESQSSTKTYAYLLQDNTYRCTTCYPLLDIKADGRDQRVAGETCTNAAAKEIIKRILRWQQQEDSKP